MRIPLQLCIDFKPPLKLSEVESRRGDLPAKGVYLLVERLVSKKAFDPFSPSVVYIGKAVRETMFSRCRKHLWSVQDARLSGGNPRTAPSDGFKRYRETIGFDPSGLWIVPGAMSVDEPYLISCAEEYLLFKYRQLHGRLPSANTAG